MIVVLDTNVLFSAFAFPGGLCSKVFRASVGRHELATSAFILNELKKHLIGKTTLSSEQVEAVLTIVSEAGPMVEPAAIDQSACRDVNDLPILGTVVASRAAVLTTGDNDLLVLEKFGAATILSPRSFFERYLSG